MMYRFLSSEGESCHAWSGWKEPVQVCPFRHPDIRAVGQSSKTTVAFHRKHGLQITSPEYLRGFKITCPRARWEAY